MNYQNVNNINKKSAVLAHRQIPLKSGSSFYLPVLALIIGGALIFSLTLMLFAAGGASVSATSASGNVKLDTEIAASIAMKIVSPNDVNPNCTPSDLNGDGVIDENDTYGVVNRYATSNGAEGSKMVDTFDGTTGGADEVNSNTSCATLSMEPNTYSSTYSDVTVYTNSPNGYALSVRSADNVSPNLVNIVDNTLSIPAGTLTEVDGTGSQSGTRVVPGAQNLWSIKGDSNSNLDTWTAVTAEDQTVRAYDMETSGGSTTRVTYGISSGNNPAGRYATTLTYTATMFDGENTSVPAALISDGNGEGHFDVDTENLKVPYNSTRSFTISMNPGYYLSSITCSNGYTCADANGDPIATGEEVTGSIIVYVTNSNKTADGTIAITTAPIHYAVTVNGNASNAPNSLTISPSSLSIPYGSSATATVTPAAGYYLESYECANGYTCEADTTTGYVNSANDGLFTGILYENAYATGNSAIHTGENATEAQTIRITNNSTTAGGTVSFKTALKSYEVAITPSINATTSTNSLKVPYGSSKTFTITPNAGYYLTGITCSSG
ncbi:hypothetical protein IJH02_01025, partial [Candidatus Saccharibacteria bacterium]|nr:hypothetical protein [Candidatus Saccharibacteria bacterium]